MRPTSIVRIDPEMIPDLFTKHHIEPVCLGFGRPGEGCGCLLTILAIEEAGAEAVSELMAKAADPENNADFIPALAALIGVKPGYVRGLLSGWDSASDGWPMSAEAAAVSAFDYGRIDAHLAFEATRKIQPVRNVNDHAKAVA